MRLQAWHWVSLEGAARQARELLTGATTGHWTTLRGADGSGARAVPGTLVVGRGLVVLPRHQRGDGSLRHRARRLGQRRQQAASKNQRRTAEADAWVILFTPDPPADAAPLPAATGPVWQRSQASYRQRWPIEEAIAMAKDAIGLYLEDLIASGEPVPEESGHPQAIVISVAA